MTPEQRFQNAVAEGISKGVRKAFVQICQLIALGSFVIVLALYAIGHYDRDATDGAERSGLKLHHDAQTGCQYLSAINGGLTPRMVSGKHMGCK